MSERSAVATVRVDTYHVPSNIRSRALPTGILLSEVLMYYYLIHMLKCPPQLEDVKRVANRSLLSKGQSPDSLVAVAKIRLQGHVSA